MKLEPKETINKAMLITNVAVSLLLIAGIASVQGQTIPFYKIPKQTIYPHQIIGDTIDFKLGFITPATTKRKDYKMDVDAFDVSSQITLGEYKIYLKDMKADSSGEFYLSQFPDSSILLKALYKEYMSTPSYDNYPIVGVSLDNALNFCKWKTLKDNKSDSLKFIYRLPITSEWLGAYDHLNKNKIKNDFNKNYSDWLLSSYEEASYDFSANSDPIFALDIVFLGKHSERVMKRHRFIGDSYFFQREGLSEAYGYGYADKGYKFVSFRIIKHRIDENTFHLDKRHAYTKDRLLLEYWGLKSAFLDK